jgi:hypothetical protein
MFATAIPYLPGQIAPTSVSLGNGVQVMISTKLGTPAAAEAIHVEMVRASGNSFYRIFRDQNHLAVFAYELKLGLSGSGDSLAVTAALAETEFAARFPNADGGKPVPTLSTEQRASVTSGRGAEFGLFELEGQGLRVIDTVQLKLLSGVVTGRIHLAGLRISINGKPMPNTASGAVAGRFVMFYLPGQGAFFFSTEQIPDKSSFVKAGMIDRNRMSFSLDNNQYDVAASSQILGDPPSGELWVYHDPAYKPAGNWTQNLRNGPPAHAAEDEFFMAASDSLSWWLPQEQSK